MESLMRNQFKKINENNTIALIEAIGGHIETGWQMAEKACERVDVSLNAVPDGDQFDQRKWDCLLMLRNSIADLCCCLDSLERGHTRTLQNNLRMCMEDFALVIMLYTNDKAYTSFLNNQKVNGSSAIGYMKNHEHGHEMYGHLWGLLSEISHHSQRNLLARQTVYISSDHTLQTLLKAIDIKGLQYQLIPLLFIIFLFRSIGEYAERICIELLEATYFWVKTPEGHQQNLNIPLAAAYQNLVDKCTSIYPS